MTVHHYLTDAARVIAQTNLSSSGPYALYAREYKLVCIPCRMKTQHHLRILDVTPLEITKGLTPARWNFLDGMLRHLAEEGIIK